MQRLRFVRTDCCPAAFVSLADLIDEALLGDPKIALVDEEQLGALLRLLVD